MSPGARPDRFRPTPLTRLQARLGRRLLILVGRGLFRFRFEFAGLDLVPPSEPLIVAAAPYRSWIDPFLVIIALPPAPRPYFLAAAEGMYRSRWKRAVLWLMGGVVPVWSERPLNRESLETSLAILDGGNRLGIFPEGWGQTLQSATELQPIKRGVAFLSERTGCRVLPVGLAGTQELWRGKTLRLRVGPPLESLPADVPRPAEQLYADRIGEAIRAVLPPPPPDPATGKKPWPWLTRLLA
jgi:1-acyl-sn-glycerol-3-phosphate acyltransferase